MASDEQPTTSNDPAARAMTPEQVTAISARACMGSALEPIGRGNNDGKIRHKHYPSIAVDCHGHEGNAEFLSHAQSDVLLLVDEVRRLTAAHARCTNLSNAEAARIFQEAREMREERDAALAGRFAALTANGEMAQLWAEDQERIAAANDRADALAVEVAELRALFRLHVDAFRGKYGNVWHATADTEVSILEALLARPSPTRGAEILAALREATNRAGAAEARLTALIDGIGQVVESRMGVCPLCDEHWNRHGLTCPLRGMASLPEHPFMPMSGSQDSPGQYTRCSVGDCDLPPEQHGMAAPSDGAGSAERHQE